MKVAHVWTVSNQDSKIKAYVKVETSEGFVINGFKVVNGDKGLFVGWPDSPRQKNGETQYVRNIWTVDENQAGTPEAAKSARFDPEGLYSRVNDMILEAYFQETGNGGNGSNQSPVQQRYQKNWAQDNLQSTETTAPTPAPTPADSAPPFDADDVSGIF